MVWVSTASESLSSTEISFREPLRYTFEGYSITLTLEQYENDLDKALVFAAARHGLEPVPEPHVTLLYYLIDTTEEEVRRRFCELVQSAITSWPPLETVGLSAGIDPTMSWIELTLATNPLHEQSLDLLHGIFSDAPRNAPWTPHLSLAYDNPDNYSPLNDIGAAHEVVQQFPTLLSRRTRKVTSLRLWSTYGNLDDWYCLDTIHF